jgi:hypothetical protein
MMLAEVRRHISGTPLRVQDCLQQAGILPDKEVAQCSHIAFERKRAETWIEEMKSKGIRKVVKVYQSDVAADTAATILAKAEAPLPGPVLTRMLRKRRIDLGKHKPDLFVRKVMWRRRDLFVYIPRQGYWLAKRATPSTDRQG